MGHRAEPNGLRLRQAFIAADSGSRMYSFVSALGSTYGAGLAVAAIVTVERFGLRSAEGPLVGIDSSFPCSPWGAGALFRAAGVYAINR